MNKATREVRFAVVLYGGTSLAIYMNGISQELLRMVRGSSDEKDLDPVEEIYREISGTLHPGTRTRFVIDIVSGTSAGGINGVALAKALVVGSKNLDVLRAAWTDEANIDQLLNDRLVSRWSKTEAVLDGGLMYDVLHRTLAGMGDAGKGKPLVDMVDLFVTATDLVGRSMPIQLTGQSVDEPVHKTVFHFAYATDPENPGKALVNDFTSNTMLAFAARCTSSFPIAFAPMRLSDVPENLRREDLSRFFPGGENDATRVYADGGYLDTKPFSHAIDLIPFRSARLPGQRKLLFVDPFPDGRGATRDGAGREIDFITNARLAATTLPRREVIRDDLRQIYTMNRRLERLGALQARWQTDRIKLNDLGRLNEPRPKNIEKLYLSDLIQMPGYGEQYPLYHHLRVYGTADTLSNLVAGLAGIAPESATAAYLRQLVRAWRDKTFEAYATAGLRSETAFLNDYDLDFRLRRLTHLRANVTDLLGRSSPNEDAAWKLWNQIEVELIRLRQLANPTPADRKTFLGRLDVDAIVTALEADYKKFEIAIDLAGKYAAAVHVYEGASKKLINEAMTAIGVTLRGHFDDTSKRILNALAGRPLSELIKGYEGFHWHDVVTFPFLEGTTAEEHSEVQVFRVSPADSGLDPRSDKLAGISYGAFGGFLSRDWREHDILWGRLDGAESIVNALIPDPADARRAEYVKKLQEAILTEEFGKAGKNRREAMVRRLVAADKMRAVAAFIKEAPPIATCDEFGKHYGKPLDPETPQLAGWASRAGRILARMLDDLPDNGAVAGLGRVAGPVRTASVLAARLTLFATPGGYPGFLAERALLLVLLLGVMLVAISLLAAGTVPLWLGPGIILGAAALWSLLYMMDRLLRGRTSLPAAARWILVVLGLALAAVGLWTVARLGFEQVEAHFPNLALILQR